MAPQKSKQQSTSWGHVAPWYHHLLEGNEDTYQKKVILPHLARLMRIKKGERIVDIGCGQGFFARAWSALGAEVSGVDVAPELIALARGAFLKKSESHHTHFETAPAHDMPFIASHSVDKATMVLMLQNVSDVHGTLKECSRILKPKGVLYAVMNHPAFRIPKQSSWGYDAESGNQYRRIDGYMTEGKIKIQMHPGDRPNEHTISFHRPLQFYFKALGKNGLYVKTVEEWVSHKRNGPGPRAEAENRARKEIPLFICVEAVKSI